jgi:heat shock protein HtpX
MRTFILFSVLLGIFLAVGSLWGTFGMLTALIFALLLNFASYWYSDKVVLAIYRAKIVSKKESPRLYRVVEKLANKAKLPMPKVAIMKSSNPNAFATGRNKENATVCATTGILDLLDNNELEAVFAHELGHINNRDILVSTISATLAGAIMILGRLAWFMSLGRNSRQGGNALGFLLTMFLAPVAAMIVQLAISRDREYGADIFGASLTKKPKYLISALTKISSAGSRHPMRLGNQASAHMFILNPFRAQRLAGLFSTHPPLAERVKRLEGLSL